MKLMTAFLLLILFNFPAFSQQSSALSSDSMICFTDAELEAMEVEAAQIMEDAVVEAVNAAVEPYRIVVQNMNADLEAMETSRNWWRVGSFAGFGVGLILAFLVVLAH